MGKNPAILYAWVRMLIQIANKTNKLFLGANLTFYENYRQIRS